LAEATNTVEIKCARTQKSDETERNAEGWEQTLAGSKEVRSRRNYSRTSHVHTGAGRGKVGCKSRTSGTKTFNKRKLSGKRDLGTRLKGRGEKETKNAVPCPAEERGAECTIKKAWTPGLDGKERTAEGIAHGERQEGRGKG